MRARQLAHMLACSLAGQGVIGCTDAPTTTEKTHARPASDARPLPAPAGAGEAERGAPELTPLDQVTVVAGEIVEIRGSKMVLDPEDTVVSRVLKRDGIWEPMETELMERELREGDVVVDAGANLGYYTLLAARKVGPNGRVFAFEPEPRAFALLQRNVALNGLTNVTLIPKALGRAPGSLKLYLAPRNHGDHRVYDPSGKRASIDVEVVRLDLALRELGAGRVDFMKIDTQGADCAILEGAGDLLDTSRELAIVLEFTPSALITVGDDPRACLERLTALGFDLVDIREWDRELVATDVEALLARYPASDPKRFTNLFLPRRARN